MRAVTSYIICKYGDDLLSISERKDFHPESSLLSHISIVASRLEDNNELYVAALYHDLGKIFTYREFANSYGHEETSAWLLMEDRDMIESKGLDFDKIYFVVKNHTRAHVILEDRPYNSGDFEIMRSKYFPDLKRFAEADDMLK
jgi:CRISPR/Cas system-associated endonuclease Cas3-HD